MTDSTNATVSAAPRRFVVNPYLHEVAARFLHRMTEAIIDNPVLDGLLEQAGPLLPDQGRGAARTREAVAALHRENALVVLLDALDGRVFITSRERAGMIGRLRRRPDEIAALRAEQPSLFRRLLAAGVVASEAAVLYRHRYDHMEIEINRHCNYRCVFCPVAERPKPRGFMDDDLFTLVLERAAEYGHIRYISLNHYSEPTLHPGLVNRVRLAAELNLQVRIHTNASLLNEEKIAALADLGNVDLVINLPSLDREAYERQTGAKLFDRVLENLESIHRHGIETTLSINSPRDSRDEAVRAINERFADMFGPSVAWPTDSRAGLIDKKEYVIPVRLSGRLAGCTVAVRQIQVSWEGRVFLCCQDFDQEVVFGDLRTETVREVAESDTIIEVRRALLGLGPPPRDFICNRCEWTTPLDDDGDSMPFGSPHKVFAMTLHSGRLLELMHNPPVVL